MAVSIAVPNLPSADLSVARQFFVNKLGFGVVFDNSDNGRSGLLGLERQGMRINVDSPMEGHGRNVCVSFEVDDVDALYKEWSRVLDNVRPPSDQPWGARTFEFQDPDGNTIFVLSWT